MSISKLSPSILIIFPIGATTGGIDLSLTGMRMAPLDPKTKQATVGIKNEVKRNDQRGMGEQKQRIMKERVTYSGGFKIPEDARKSASRKRKQKLEESKDEEDQGAS